MLIAKRGKLITAARNSNTIKEEDMKTDTRLKTSPREGSTIMVMGSDKPKMAAMISENATGEYKPPRLSGR